MFKDLSVKTKLLIPTFSLIVILLFLGSMIIVFSYTKIVSLGALNEKILFGNIISDTLHSLQKERGLSTGFLTNIDDTFTQELLLQRKKSDKNIERLFDFLTRVKCESFKEKVEKELLFLKNLQLIRKNIDNHHLTYNDVIKRYLIMNRSLLSIIVYIAKSSHIPNITENILAYSHLLYLKENLGLERAKGVVILSKGELTPDILINFTNLIAVQNQHEQLFFEYASEEILQYYNAIVRITLFKDVKILEQELIKKEFLHENISAKYWYNLMTDKLDALDSIAKYIKARTTLKIDKKIEEAQRLFVLVVFLTIVSLLIFIYMIIIFLRLAKEEQRLRVVMDKYIISSVTDTKGKILDVSEAFCKISGYTKEELIGQPHKIVRHPDMSPTIFKELWSKIQKGDSWSGKVKNRKKDGGFYWVYANIEPLYNTKGIIDSYISIRLDITENELLLLKILEEEKKNKLQENFMQKQQRLAQMGEMISMIAHQWRQPLSAITAATGSLTLKAKRNKLDMSTAVELSERIKEFSLHLSSTIDDFRNFFKSNKVKTTTDFQKIVESVISIVEASLKKNKITLCTKYKNIQEFVTYENELKQVLLNLIKNAEDALLEEGVKEGIIYLTIDGMKLSVEDNAGGIPESITEKIFEPYFSTKMKKDGTGLGLYMSKLIIEDHCEGQLSVKNSINGAEFTISLGEKDD